MDQLTQEQIDCLARELIVVGQDRKHRTVIDARDAMQDYIIRRLYAPSVESLCLDLYGYTISSVRSYEEKWQKMSAEISRWLAGEVTPKNWGERL